MTRSVTVSGLVNEFTGVGVLQRALYPRLENLGFSLRVSDDREPRRPTFPGRVTALARALTSRPEAGGLYLSTVNPFPLRPGQRAVSLVHDLQWMKTKTGIERTYHDLDLRRTVARSQALITITQRVHQDLVAFAPGARHKVTVHRLGPGIVDRPEYPRRTARDVLLVGGAPHKRNELAAEMLVAAPDLFDRVVGVGVSDEVRRRCEEALGPARCVWQYRIPREELVEWLRHVWAFVLLGTDEGFGLPFIEALASGAHVVAIDQPLTRELLDDAGVLLTESGPGDLAEQWRSRSSSLPTEERRRARARDYSWDDFAAGVAHVLTEVAETPKGDGVPGR
jgi:glycosyltransferase involved in cell wall biosynthesis